VGTVRVRWTKEALSEPGATRRFIAGDNPKVARKIATRIRTAATKLGRHPEIGRSGRVPGTRELVIPGTPYLLVYAVLPDRVAVLTLLHGAQDYP
jgi:addiction module RelE/StbE family toxin